MQISVASCAVASFILVAERGSNCSVVGSCSYNRFSKREAGGDPCSKFGGWHIINPGVRAYGSFWKLGVLCCCPCNEADSVFGSILRFLIYGFPRCAIISCLL